MLHNFSTTFDKVKYVTNQSGTQYLTVLYRGIINVCITKNSCSANLYLIILYHSFRFVINLNMSFWFPKNCYALTQLPLFICTYLGVVVDVALFSCFVLFFFFFFLRSMIDLPFGKIRSHTARALNNRNLTTKFLLLCSKVRLRREVQTDLDKKSTANIPGANRLQKQGDKVIP